MKSKLCSDELIVMQQISMPLEELSTAFTPRVDAEAGCSPEHPLGTSTNAKDLIANLNRIRQLKCTPCRSSATSDARAPAPVDLLESNSAFDPMKTITGLLYPRQDRSGLQKHLSFLSPQPQPWKYICKGQDHEKQGHCRHACNHEDQPNINETFTPAKNNLTSDREDEAPSRLFDHVQYDKQRYPSSGFLNSFFQNRTLTFLENWPFQRKHSTSMDPTNIESVIKLAKEQARHDLNNLGDELQTLVSQMECELQEERFVATQKEACLQMVKE